MSAMNNLFDELETATMSPCDVICEAYDDYMGAANTYNRTLINAQMVSNTALRDYELNCKQAKLRCIQEDGTDDDYNFYVEAAEQGALGKLRAIFDRIIQLWKDMCAKIQIMIETKICTAQAKSAVNKMGKQIKMNPQVANSKVNAPDMSSALALINKYRANLDKQDAKMIKGLSGRPQEIKGLIATIDSFVSSFNNSYVGAAATCVVTVAGLVAAIEAEMDKLPAYSRNLEASQSHIFKRLSATVSDETAAYAMGALQQSANFRVQLGKQELDTRIQWIHDAVKVLNDKYIEITTGRKPINVNVKLENGEELPIDNSYDDMINELSELGTDGIIEENGESFMEGATAEAFKARFNYGKEYAKSMGTAKKYYKQGKYSEAKAELKNTKKILADFEKAINDLEPTTGSTMCGMIVGSVLYSLKFTLASLATFGIGGIAVSLKELYDVLEVEKEAGAVKAEHYNLVLTKAKASIISMRKAIAKMEAACGVSRKDESWDDSDFSLDEFLAEDASAAEAKEEAELDAFLEEVLDSVLD
jgi:hypothetical protein